MDAELDLRQAERPLVRRCRDTIIASERELETAAERKSVDGGDRRNAEQRDAPEDALTARGHLRRLRRVAQPRELVDVGAEDEAAAFGRLEDDAARRRRAK